MVRYIELYGIYSGKEFIFNPESWDKWRRKPVSETNIRRVGFKIESKNYPLGNYHIGTLEFDKAIEIINLAFEYVIKND